MNVLLMVVVLADAVSAPEAPPTRVGRQYVVGEGWGCARVVADRRSGWECWQAAPSVQAFRVPWMNEPGIAAGPDRLCAMEGDDVRCVRPPRRGDRAPRPIEPLPLRAPAAADSGPQRDLFYEKSYLFDGLVGGTFACPTSHKDIWCAGDNSFGQLGTAGTPAARPPLLGAWVVENVGLGTWHGCAWKAGEPLADDGLYCWGRGDGGQLGVAAPDVCRVAGKDVACARRPVRVPVDFRLPGREYTPDSGRGDLRAGDMFTCAQPPRTGTHQKEGIVCWGASRDGLFGSPALCPPGLSQAWPTRGGGAVAAPGASCSPTPVAIPGSDRLKRSVLAPGAFWPPPWRITNKFDIGPRGICLVSETGEIWCKGAIATPRNLVAANVSVSPGENASACAATRKGQLYCWGEGYSPANAPDRPVAIAFEPLPQPPPNPNPAPIDAPARPLPWGESCSVHRPCERVARTIPACSPATQGITAEAAELAAEGQTVSVQGTLRAGASFMTAKGCSEIDPDTQERLPAQACCNLVRRRIIVGDGRGILLGGIGCFGDESRLCCDVAVHGQTVIATGKLLRREPDPFEGPQTHRLEDAKICSVPNPSGAHGGTR